MNFFRGTWIFLESRKIDTKFELRLLVVLQLKLAETITHSLGDHQLAGPQAHREVAHLELGQT